MWTLIPRGLSARLLALALALATGSGGAALAQNSPDAQRVFNRAREASGGSGWNLLHGWHEVGEDGGQRYERWLDPIRYGARTELATPGGKLLSGYNGAGEWRVLADGARTGSIAPEVLHQVRADTFFGVYGYFFPSRFDLRSSHVGVRQSQGRSFDVLRVQPAGGEPRELWFDRKTGLLGLIVEEAAPSPLTTEVSDYRKVGPVLVPHRFVTYGGGLPRPRERKLQALDFRPADRGLFSLPPPPRPATP